MVALVLRRFNCLVVLPVFVVLVVWSCVVGWVVLVMVIGGRVGCLSGGPFRAVFRRPGRVAREIVVVSVGYGWLYI